MMVSNPIKKFWFICLCLTSLSLVWCFHVPDEDRLPSKNKVETIQKDNQVEQALNSFIDWIGMVSSQRNDMKDNELYERTSEELSGYTIETEGEAINREPTNSEETSNIITE